MKTNKYVLITIAVLLVGMICATSCDKYKGGAIIKAPKCTNINADFVVENISVNTAYSVYTSKINRDLYCDDLFTHTRGQLILPSDMFHVGDTITIESIVMFELVSNIHNLSDSALATFAQHINYEMTYRKHKPKK